MWELYDALISKIPDDIEVTEFLSGSSMTYVCAGDAAGVCETIGGGLYQAPMRSSSGISLKELAGYAKSWNYIEASLGLAAINCFYNAPDRLSKAGCRIAAPSEHPYRNLHRRLERSSAALCGHMPYFERALPQSCEISVITDRDEAMGDYPAGAVEYILSGKAFVLADGGSIIQKRLERLLRLSRSVCLLGLGIPLWEGLLDFGVLEIHGFVVTDTAVLRALIAAGAGPEALLPTFSAVTLTAGKGGAE